MRSPTLVLTVILGMVLAAPATAAEPVTLPTESMSAEDSGIIDSLVGDTMTNNPELPAMYVGVWHPELGAEAVRYRRRR